MRSNETILVLDDDLSIGKFVKDSIATEGKRVLLASNAKEGLEHLQQNHVDVIFTDLQLPDADGISVIRKALQIHPNIASVVITGFGSLESSIEAMRLGACDYITKPFTRKQIIRSLHHAIDLKQSSNSNEQQSPINPAKDKPLPVIFVASSRLMREVDSLATKVSGLDIPVLIHGEVGVGKKLLARLIHSRSPDADGPFSHINCSTIIGTEHLNKQGIAVLGNLLRNDLSERTCMGTIFLEDIEQLPIWEQKQLLNMLEEGSIKNPWSTASGSSSVRLIASTTVDLKEEVSAGRFHRSLYDCLNLTPIKIPPLRERHKGIKPLGIHILEQLSCIWNCKSSERRHRVSDNMWELFLAYKWPGNVQELATVLAHILLMGDCPEIIEQMEQSQQPSHAQSNKAISVPFIGDLKSMECHMIGEVVKRCGGNKAAAAKALGMHRRTLYRVLENEKHKSKSHQATG